MFDDLRNLILTCEIIVDPPDSLCPTRQGVFDGYFANHVDQQGFWYFFGGAKIRTKFDGKEGFASLCT